ncbi:MAG: YwaF family protein [Microbacteriaceae bacterium]|nr:YwaF family protein [Microbacteriaceae bacterium]MCL2795815.1 YwaF family protein [Microbacteriaceae bacterium]
MTPFTTTWALYLVLLTAAFVGLWAVLRRHSVRTQRLTLFGLALANWGISTWFTFDRIASHRFPGFTFSTNWPLHFCTLATILLVPAMLADRQRWAHPLQTLLFFPGAVAGILALASPGTSYMGTHVWSMGSLFYVVHGFNAAIPFTFAALGLYRPRWRDAALSLVWFTILGMIVLGITVLARAFVDPHANYMYFFGPEGAGILVLLWNAIRIPMVYELPLLPIIYPVLLLVLVVQRGLERLGRAAGPRRADGAPPLAPDAAVVA